MVAVLLVIGRDNSCWDAKLCGDLKSIILCNKDHMITYLQGSKEKRVLDPSQATA